MDRVWRCGLFAGQPWDLPRGCAGCGCKDVPVGPAILLEVGVKLLPPRQVGVKLLLPRQVKCT
eukprot:354537-Chlamydomonas_euryale.AAC.1